MTKTSFKWLGILIYIRIHVYGVKGQGEEGSVEVFVEAPIPLECQSRTKVWEYNGHWYDIVYTAHEWLPARNICRRQCMDAVAIETEDEADMIAYVVAKVSESYGFTFSTWTSGRRCDFKQCKDSDGNYFSHLLPLDVNGWFFAGTKLSIPPTNQTTWTQNPWSQVGPYGPQPDNGEFKDLEAYDVDLDEEDVESCMAVLNIYGDGVKWHDIACYQLHPVICEDDDALITYVKYYNPNLNI